MNDGTGDTSNRNSEAFYKLRDEETRALNDVSLPHGAVRLFIMICKLLWFPEAGGFYNGKLGTLKASVSDLAKFIGANVKSFYFDKKKNRKGWLELLSERNYLWIGKHVIRNGEAMNVYHVTVLDSRIRQTALLFQSRFHASPVTENGNGFFLGKNSGVSSPHGKTGNGHYQNRQLSKSTNGNSEHGKTGNGNYQNRKLPITARPSDQLPQTGTGNAQLHQSPTGKNGNGQHGKTVKDGKSILRIESKEDSKGTFPPQDSTFKEWSKKVGKMYPRELKDLRIELLDQFKKAKTETAKTAINEKLDVVRVALYGPAVPISEQPAKPRPTRKAPPETKPLSEEQLLESAREARALGAKFLTEGQRAALEMAGEL